MTWTKTSDDYPDDCWSLSDAAYRLHHEGLTWSNRKLLDCAIHKDDLRRFAKRPEAIDELITCGFWTDEGDHYRIRHHAGYQRTREQVVRMQERNQRNGKAGGRPPKAPREVWETHLGSEAGTQMETQGDRSGQDGPGQREDRSDGTQQPQAVPLPRMGGVDLPSGEAPVCGWCMGPGCLQCKPEMFETEDT